MIGPNCVIISKDDLADAPDEVKTWMSTFFFGGAAKPTTKKETAAEKKKRLAAEKKAKEEEEVAEDQPEGMKALMELAGVLMKTAEGKKTLKMAMKMTKVDRVSECPEDKIADMMALLSED